MKNKSVYVLLRFRCTYQMVGGDEGTWDFYAQLFPSGHLKVFNPEYTAQDCVKRNYFNGRAATYITNKGNVYIEISSIIAEFTRIAVKNVFFPFRDMAYGYYDPYVPQVGLTVKMDTNCYEGPIQIKGNTEGNWITVDTRTKHLEVSPAGSHRTMQDEEDYN